MRVFVAVSRGVASGGAGAANIHGGAAPAVATKKRASLGVRPGNSRATQGLVDFTGRPPDNRDVRHRLRALVAVAVLLAVSSAANELSDVRSAAAAMACCAKTDYQCAGLRTPDECCKRMHHSPGHVAPSTAPVERNGSAAPAVAPLPVAYLPFSRESVVATSPDFTRPHDPPHLHAFSLLI